MEQDTIFFVTTYAQYFVIGIGIGFFIGLLRPKK